MIKYFLTPNPKEDLKSIEADLAVVIKRKKVYESLPNSVKKVYIDKKGIIKANNYFSTKEDFETSKAILLRYAVILGYVRKEQMKFSLNRYKLKPKFTEVFDDITRDMKKYIYKNINTKKDFEEFYLYIKKFVDNTIYEAIESKMGKKYILLYQEIVDFMVNLSRSLFHSYIDAHFDMKYFYIIIEGYVFTFIVNHLSRHKLSSEDKMGDYLSNNSLKAFVRSFNEQIHKLKLERLQQEYDMLQKIKKGKLGIRDYVYVSV